VFDRRKLLIGSMNYDQRSQRINTEVGLIIDSPELAQQTVARFDAMALPENSYALSIRADDAGARPHLVWNTKEEGRAVQYLREPARNLWQRLKVRVMSWLPLDREL
jgi:putative cardiolipin synthase